MVINRFLLIFLAFFISSGFLVAQDIGITGISNKAYTEVKQGTSRNIGLQLKVFGTTSETTVNVDYQINNGDVTRGLSMLSLMTITQGSGLVPCPVRFPATLKDTVEVKLFVSLKGDTNSTNDTIRGMFVVKEKVANDIRVELAEPLEGADITVGTSQALLYSLTNVGTNDFETGTDLLVYQLLDGEMYLQPQSASYAGRTLKPGEVGTYTTEIYLDQRHEGKDVEFCQYLYWSALSDTALATLEGNLEDNVVCTQFKAVPSSLNDLTTSPWIHSLRYAHQELQISFNPSATHQPSGSLTVLNTAGQLVAQQTFSANTQQMSIPLSHAQPGVYLVQLSSSNGRVSTRRFVVGM